jgi:hypothetical protein
MIVDAAWECCQSQVPKSRHAAVTLVCRCAMPPCERQPSATSHAVSSILVSGAYLLTYVVTLTVRPE